MHDPKTTDVARVPEAAVGYFRSGLEPIRLQPANKKPIGKWAEPRTWTEAEIKREFTGADNVGIALGQRSNNLVDIDFDCPEAAYLAKTVLGHLPSFGRHSSPHSHRVTYAKLERRKVEFKMPENIAHRLSAPRAMLLEIRGDGHQSMFPPSLHPSGERVTWHDSLENIPSSDGIELQAQCGLVAALSVVLMSYPRVSGDRDNICLALAGTLARTDLGDEEIDDLIFAVASFAGDEEAEKRRGKAAASRAKFDAGEPVWGLPELCKRLELPELEPRLREWLQLGGDAVSTDGRPIIVVQPGNIPAEVDAIEAALLARGLGIYQRGEDLVRVVRLPQSEGSDGVRRASGIVLIRRIEQPWLKEQMALAASWLRPSQEGLKPMNPPASHAAALLARVGDWNAPVLNAVVTTPTMWRDGTILQTPGYDPKSGLLYDPGKVTFPAIPEAPSKEDAIAAVDRLYRPFRDFEVATPADRAVVLATCITALIRRNLPSAPMTAIDAPTAGSGKSLLAETIGIIASGHNPTMMSQGKTAEEDEKRLSTVLMAGDPVLVIDNCDRPLAGDAICTALTQEFMAARILGKSELSRMPTNVLIMATGNNLEIAGDLGRRTLIVRIDTGAERPDQIEHDFDPRAEALSDRPELVVAALTILRAYLAAGRPNKTPPMGSFEVWNLVREALLWVGEADPVSTRDRVIADDPRKGELAELLEIWDEAMGERPVTLAEIEHEGSGGQRGPVFALYSALASRTKHNEFNPRSIGRHLAKLKDRIVGGRVLRCHDDPSGVKRYQLQVVGPRDQTALDI